MVIKIKCKVKKYPVEGPLCFVVLLASDRVANANHKRKSTNMSFIYMDLHFVRNTSNADHGTGEEIKVGSDEQK